ncbi:arginine--tRNA ligase [Holospora curviuscula]|uniref:Arginine--tRNA ligase n=1 Tax=Holospora curviuscula TaxID=1082868 RepID=A0A2S5RA77_9PROT|nr:arginine--tRNA ligase [Holospora curviuscula]PPE04203.1 Arginine--tRNA ligase [Holospora curviuscula]
MEVFLSALRTWVIDRLIHEGYTGIDLNFFLVTEKNHGDFTTHSAFAAAKKFAINPMIIAQRICFHTQTMKGVEKAVVAGSGFVNITIEPHLWGKWVHNILDNPTHYGQRPSKNSSVNIEYVSANPTGPLHIGHGRCAVIGDVLANIMNSAGYTVTREYYVNDAGNQITLLAKSVYQAYKTLLGENQNEEVAYPGEYIQEIGKQLLEQEGTAWMNVPSSVWEPYIKLFSVQRILHLIQKDLDDLRIHHDVFTCERFLYQNGNIEETFSQLRARGWVYEGIMEAPKSYTSENEIESVSLPLLRTSLWGDTKDRALRKPDGTWTYFAADLAYHMDKVRRGFSVCIDILGADHIGHVTRLKGAIETLADHSTQLEMICCQMVRFLSEGNPIKMSKRTGNFISIQDILHHVDVDTFRFFMVNKKGDTHFDLNIEDMKACTKDNAIFYIQYAHARCCSVLRHGTEIWPFLKEKGWWRDVILNSWGKEHQEGIGLALDFPRLIESAAQTREPHIICTGLYKLAQCFHSLWQQGSRQTELRFLDEKEMMRSLAHLVWVYAISIVLKRGLAILGIEAKEAL